MWASFRPKTYGVHHVPNIFNSDSGTFSKGSKAVSAYLACIETDALDRGKSVIVIRDPTQIDGLADTELRQLLHHYVDQYRQYPDYRLEDLLKCIVVEEGDSIADIDVGVGFHILSNRHTGAMFGDAGFTPDFEIYQEHTGWFELVWVHSDGYGFQVFVPKGQRVDTALQAFCAAYAS